MSYSLQFVDLSFYIDPFTNEKAIFNDEKIAQITRFMLFDQQELILEIVEN